MRHTTKSPRRTPTLGFFHGHGVYWLVRQIDLALGYDAKDHMMRVNYLAVDGEPNWNANFASETPAPLPVLSAFIEALAHVKAQYDVNDEDHARLLRA